MTGPPTPERWAFDITYILNARAGDDRFPVDVPFIAREFSKVRFPDDPIISVKADNLPNFDGALYRVPSRKNGWAIIYNNSLSSKGRINFTLAHEFGHYLLHRLAYPNGFECGPNKIARWDSEYGQVEHQANVFAANLLMPRDDFRRQIPAATLVDFSMLKACADRYQVSLMAATLRWLNYTAKRAVLVVSRDGFILWARSSEPAWMTGAVFRTSKGPIEIPATSLPENPRYLVNGYGEIEHAPGAWLPEAVRELTISAETYDFSLSLLILEDVDRPASPEPQPVQDTFEQMSRTGRLR